MTLGPAAAGEPLVNLDTIGLEGGRLELHRESVSARRIAVTGGRVQVERAEDGKISLLELVKERERATKPSSSGGTGKPWQFALDAFEIEKLKIALAAHGFGQPVTYDIDPLTLAVKNIRNEGRTPITLEAALRIAQEGRCA